MGGLLSYMDTMINAFRMAISGCSSVEIAVAVFAWSLLTAGFTLMATGMVVAIKLLLGLYALVVTGIFWNSFVESCKKNE